MKIRGSRSADKIEAQMAPMIDVVFQLLIFFMLTLKIIEPEGDFSVNMPLGQSPTDSQSISTVIKVKMTSNPANGWMESLKIGETELFANLALPAEVPDEIWTKVYGGLPIDPQPMRQQHLRAQRAFESLNNQVLGVIGAPGNPLADEQEVEIDADYELNAQYLINAIGACRGAMRPDTDGKLRMVDYIKKIKFSPPHAKRTP